MTLLEVITKAAANPELASFQSDFPIILNPDETIRSLKPTVENPNPASLVHHVSGWKISETDADVIDLADKFLKTVQQKMKNPNDFGKDEFIRMLNQFLNRIGGRIGAHVNVGSADDKYTGLLIEKVGYQMGRDVAGLVLEVCIRLEIWELVKVLIVNGLVKNSCYSNCVTSLVEKRRSDLLCLCIKHASDLRSSELLCILKYFLCPPADAYAAMLPVKKEWESQGLQAIEKAMDKNLTRKQSLIAKEASILLMVAHDGFTSSELCLHYLLASPNIDEAILASSIGKLSGKEMKRLLQYLSKWLRKYEKFPEAGPCPQGSYLLGFNECDWVPKLEDVVKFLGLLLDENYSSLVLRPEFQEELGLVAACVGSLAMEAKLCCAVASVAEKLKTEVKDAN